MRRLDVVAELAAHQQNLEPAPIAASSVLVALPPPAIAELLAPAWCAATRAARLHGLAEELGGGDGALEIVELGAQVSTQLARLWNRGIRMLVVDGARDRPGHARALRYRWPGALRELPDSIVDDWLDPREPVRVLASGLVRIAPGVAIPNGAERVLVALDDTGDPARAATLAPNALVYAVDPRRRAGCWSGIVPPSALHGTAAAQAIRARWDAHWSARGQPDAVRCAVLGLDPTLAADLREPARTPAPDRRATVVAIAGIDGSGKSSQVARLATTLRDRGARVSVLKLYRQGAFLELANELGARTWRGAPLAAFRTSRIVKLVDSLRVYRDQLLPALATCDAIVLDRYVETHVAAAESQLGWDLADHPALAVFPRADLQCWLELDPAVALARRDARGERASADEHAVGLAGYAGVFARFARRTSELRLDATTSEAANADRIAERACALVTARGGEGEAVIGAAGSMRVDRLPRVDVGGERRPVLGGDALALRGELARWLGPMAAGVDEGFWLEAYAAQLVLDALTTSEPQASIALWPGVLAAIAGHADLVMLDELERMLLPIVRVECYEVSPPAVELAFRQLGASEAGARRLARAYVVELERIAAERGWMRCDGSSARAASSAAPSAPAS